MLQVQHQKWETDLPRAKNIADFVENYLQLPVMYRTIVASRILGEICVFCSNIKAVEQFDAPGNARDSTVFFEYGVCPKCGKTKADHVSLGYANNWEQANIAIGQRGGKALFLSLIVLYQEHRMLTLQRDGLYVAPNDLFNLGDTTLLSSWHGCSVEGYKHHVCGLRNESPWFQNYFGYLDNVGSIVGIELYARSTTSVEYKLKKICTEFEVNDVRVIRGTTKYLAVMDEFAWLTGCDPERIYKSLNIALTTARNVKNDISLGLLVSATSRSCKTDITSKFPKDSTTYSRNFATWEFNRESNSIREDFPTDQNSRRDFEGIV